MAQAQIYIESNGGPNGTRVLMDGKDVTDMLVQLSFEHSEGSRPIVILHWACYDQMTFDGKSEVHHICPKGGRK